MLSKKNKIYHSYMLHSFISKSYTKHENKLLNYHNLHRRTISVSIINLYNL